MEQPKSIWPKNHEQYNRVSAYLIVIIIIELIFAMNLI